MTAPGRCGDTSSMFAVALVSASALSGRLPGFAGAGLLQVRASALIPCGDGLRPPSGSLTQGLGPTATGLRPGRPSIRPARRPVALQVRALAARRFADRLGACWFGDAVFPESFTLSVTVRPRRQETGCAFKGVFIKLRFTNLPPCSPVCAVAVRHRAKNSGKTAASTRKAGRCDAGTLIPRGSESWNPAFASWIHSSDVQPARRWICPLF